MFINKVLELQVQKLFNFFNSLRMLRNYLHSDQLIKI